MKAFTTLSVFVLWLILARANAGCTGSTGWNSSLPNKAFTHIVVSPMNSNRSLAHYVVPSGTSGLLIYAVACYGNLSFSKLSYQVPDWNAADWTPSSTSPKRGFKLTNLDIGKLVYVGIRSKGVGEATDYNATGVMDVLMTNDDTYLTSLVPIPGESNNNNSLISSKITMSSGKATISWDRTKNDQDKYSIYRLDVSKTSDFGAMMPPTGYYLTACSYKCWMNYDDAATTAITEVGTTASTVIKGLNKNNVTIVAVVITRNDGYQSAYQIIGLNNANKHNSFFALLFLLLSLSLFF